LLYREVEALHLVPGPLQRSRRRRDVKRLVAELVGGYQQNSHPGQGSGSGLRFRLRGAGKRAVLGGG
jgi:hypothetical protein